MNGSILLAGCLLLTLCCWPVAADEQVDTRFTSTYDRDRAHPFSPDFPNRAAWERRAQFLRHQALVAQGLWPMPQKTPLQPVIHGTIEKDDYTIEKVYFASMPGHYVSGNLYRPKARRGKMPAVLAPYGHWPDGRFWWRSDENIRKELDTGAEKIFNAARSPLQANAVQLARMGCVVFQYDMVGYCDSTKIPHREGFLDAEAILRLQSFMGLQTWNSIRALDFVLSLEDVDPTRIGVTGSSSGGTQTMALNAVDSRTTAAVPSVMVSMNMQGGCVCENAPLYRVHTNNVEIACLFAPKPQGMAAANDWTVDFETRGLPEMKKIWSLYDAADAVHGKHFNFGHNHNLHSRLLQYAFFNEHLKLGITEPIEERDFEIIEPKQLSVWDEQHPLPADAMDAAGLREQMTRSAETALASLRDDEYRQTLRTALQAMVVDQLPATGDVVVDDGFMTRQGAGERVPIVIVRPQSSNGQVVVWAHPEGTRGVNRARKLVDAGYTVIAIDPFAAGDFVAPPAPATQRSRRGNPNPAYAAYKNGYNRTIIAERVHDLLTAIAYARSVEGARKVHLIGAGEQGIVALLARGVAGDAIDRAAIDLNGFDFSKITNDEDPMLLPGALKYGGVWGFATLCDTGSTLLTYPASQPTDRVRRMNTIQVATDNVDAAAWLLEQK